MKTIVLEGPNGAGKSTLAAELVRLDYNVRSFGVPIREERKSEESIFKFFFEPLYQAVAVVQRPIVFDRLHLSEQIYGPLMRGGTKMQLRGEHLIERYLEAVDGQIVICLPPRRIITQNWLTRDKTKYVHDIKILNQVYDGYVALLFNKKRNRNFVWYDYTRHRARSFASALQTVEGRQLGPGMVGSQRPRFLVVGEQAVTRWDLPFMTTRGCSGWLCDVLVEAGYQEHELAFINTIQKPEPMGRLRWFSDELITSFNGTIIALGQVPYRVLGGIAGARFHAFEHPQYAKRFQAKERANYVRRLTQLRRNSP